MSESVFITLNKRRYAENGSVIILLTGIKGSNKQILRHRDTHTHTHHTPMPTHTHTHTGEMKKDFHF